MPDCTNVEMRELLPDLLHGRLAPEVRREAESHLASCEDCAAEFELLRAVRRMHDETPAVDVARIVAALPRPVAARPRTGFRPALRWQIAAALTMVTVGGLSVAVTRRSDDPSRLLGVESTAVIAPPVTPPAPSPDTKAAGTNASGTTAPAPAPAPAALSIAGGVSDLADDDLVALLGALEDLDSRPVAEPDSLSPIAVTGRTR